jgi:hypothetical protein
MTQAVLPYPEPGGNEFTSGHAGSEASLERALREVKSGANGARQRVVKALLRQRGAHGITVAELRTETGWHHGQASAALSNMHKGGDILRLKIKRGRCQVYVAPQFSLGREAEAPGHTKAGVERLWPAFEAAWRIAEYQAEDKSPDYLIRLAFDQWVKQGMEKPE